MRFYLPLLLIVIFAASCDSFKKSTFEAAIDRYNNSMIQYPYVSKAAYLETAKCEDTYCMYTEAYGYLFSAGYEVPVPVDNIFLFPKNMKKSDRSQNWLKYMKNTYSGGDISFQSDYPPGFSSARNAFRWFEERGLQNKLDGFEITLTDTLQSEKGPVKIYSFGNHEMFQYTGTIHVESDRNFITKITFDKIRFYSDPLREWTQASGKITFYGDEGGDRLRSIFINHKTDKFDLNIYLKVGETFFRQERIDDSRAFQLMKHKRRPFVYFYEKAWDNPFKFENIDRDQVFADLGGLKDLNKQFRHNAGKPFIEEVKDFRGETLTISDSQNVYSFVEKKMEEFSEMF